MSDVTWVGDVELIDKTVREQHADPFAVVSEDEWTSTVDELTASFPSLSEEERIVGMARLAGLLDTHTQYFGPVEKTYDVLLYRFSDGLFVVAADDESLVGARLISINGVDAEEVEAMFNPLLPADNDSARLNQAYKLTQVDYLMGLGIVTDEEHPGFAFSLPDGSNVTVDLSTSDLEAFAREHRVLGALAGDQNEALARRNESAWTRIDEATGTFVLSLNDYSWEARDAALASMKAALSDGTADRVVVDMRYLRGGEGSNLFPLVDALATNKEINQPDRLTVLIGRENESAATLIASMLERRTAATFVGEPTPARVDNFLCNCIDTFLPGSGYTFSVPTERAGNGDPRMALEPDVSVALSSTDFFAGRDPALDTALAG